MGLALAFTAVLLLEQADTRVRTVEDIRELVPGPVVGALPRWSAGEVRAIMSGETPALAEEAYSLARVNLTLALRQTLDGSSEAAQVILVTSAMPGEGKSITAAQMARSMARPAARVTLVRDMRGRTRTRCSAQPAPGAGSIAAWKVKCQPSSLVYEKFPSCTDAPALPTMVPVARDTHQRASPDLRFHHR